MKKLFSILLVILLTISLVACGSNGNGSDTTPADAVTTPTEETTAGTGPEFLLNAKLKIVRSEFITDQTIVDAMNYLRDAIEASCGFMASLSDDWYRESSGLVPYEYEILIGRTNRPQSSEAYASLKKDDYVYTVHSENSISICGGDSESTLAAVKKFCSDFFGYNGKDASIKNPTFKAGASYKYTSTYEFDKVMLNGVDIENFVIAVRNKKYVQYTVSLVSDFAQYNGYNIPVKTIDEIDPAKDKNVIYLGAAASDGSHVSSSSGAYFLTHKKEGENVTVILDAPEVKSYSSAVQKFRSKLLIEKNGKNVICTFNETDIVGYSFENSIPAWLLAEEKTTAVCDGVTYIYQKFNDEDGKLYQAYVLKIDPSKAYLYMGSTADGYALSLQGVTKQNVLSHINAAKANGIIPIAGVNADFFDMSGDYHPRGLTIKEGQFISTTGGRPWCGYTYDGQFVCGVSADYAKYEGKLRTAVGASHLIVTNGVPSNLDIGTDFSDTSHPRTLAGVTADGTIILAVIDGRQSAVSNGAPLARCALFMMSHGAVESVNLDGGGSSCMLIQLNGSYKTVNSPSDGSLRKVYNSLLVVPKN